MNKKEEEKIDKVLKKIESKSKRGKRFLPIVGPEKGKFYYLITKAIGAKRILELGTLIGYSALLFSKAMDNKGKVVTIEHDKGNYEEAMENFKESGTRQIELVHGEAKAAVKLLISKKRKFDIVFIDIEKNEYVGIFDDCLKLLGKGGIVLVDNASWDTKDLKAFRKMLRKNKLAESVIVPIEDGISMSVKR
jgi:predicted O-methyltransferase YrrM